MQNKSIWQVTVSTQIPDGGRDNEIQQIAKQKWWNTTTIRGQNIFYKMVFDDVSGKKLNKIQNLDAFVYD